MKIQILGEIDVHEDGVHCGVCGLKIIYNHKNGITRCLVNNEDLEQDGINERRTAHCLLAQQAAKGMTGGVIGKDEPNEGTDIYFVARGDYCVKACYAQKSDGRCRWQHPFFPFRQIMLVKDGDRFWPVKE